MIWAGVTSECCEAEAFWTASSIAFCSFSRETANYTIGEFDPSVFGLRFVDTEAWVRSAVLYAAFLGGDKGALEQLVIMHGDALTRFAYCIVRNDAAAEDVMADTFATLIVRRKKFREGAKFRTWLYTVARNRAIDYVRKYGRQRTLSGLENVLVGMNGEDALLARQRNETLYICLQQLPEQYKEVLYLNYFDGFSVKEICHILKKNEKQVYNLLSRARSTLKEILVKEGYNENE